MKSLIALIVVGSAMIIIIASCGKPPGAPDSSLNSAQAVAMNANYNSIQTNILTPKCISCHQGASAKHGVDLSSYQAIMAGNNSSSIKMPLITADNPSQSDIYVEVQTGDMPKHAAPLSNDEIQEISLWIQNGAQETPSSPPAPMPSPSASTQTQVTCQPNDSDCRETFISKSIDTVTKQIDKNQPGLEAQVVTVDGMFDGTNVDVKITLKDKSSLQYTCTAMAAGTSGSNNPAITCAPAASQNNSKPQSQHHWPWNNGSSGNSSSST